MRSTSLLFPSLLFVACTGKPGPDTATGDDTAPVDTSDSAPPEETGDTAPPVDTSETGDSAPPRIDNDGDGSPVEEDCNDADGTIYPGAIDAICDGVDADCDGEGEDEAFLIGETRYADAASALAGAVDGDTIDVCPGLWSANLTITGPIQLTFRGASGSNVDTELDGGNLDSVFILGEGVDLTIEDLGIINGVALWRSDELGQMGGGIFADNARLTVRGARFENNSSQDVGAGIGMLLGDTSTTGLWVEGAEFTDNRASGAGGGIGVLGSGDAEVSISDTLFSANRTSSLGAAIYLEGAPVHATLTSCTFDTNAASGPRSYGGAVNGDGEEVELTVVGGTFTNNTVGNSGAGLSLTADSSTLSVTGATFTTNNASQGGGAIQVSSDDLDLTLESCTFTSNTSSDRAGAVLLDGAGYGNLDSLTFTDNSAGSAGGGIYLDESDGGYMEVTLSSSTLTTNRAGLGGGGGVYVAGARFQASSVDFGATTSTNTPEDVFNCATNYGSGSSFVYDESTGSFCE
jgi:predicted outer membrane repeat protein